MLNKPRLLAFFLFAITFSFSSKALDLFWIGGNGNWNDGNHWALTSGGGPSGHIPTISDNVTFDSHSFSSPGEKIILNSDAFCNAMLWRNVKLGSTLEGPETSNLTINGSLLLDKNFKNNFQGNIRFTSASAATLTTLSHTFAGNIYFNGDGSWTLKDNLNAEISKIYLEKGTINSNDKNIVCGSFIAKGNAFRNLLLGRSTIKVINEWNFQESANLTLEAGSSTLIFNKNNGKDLKFGDRLLYGKIKIAPSIVPLSHVATVTVTPITCNGKCDGTATVTVTGGVGPFSYQWIPSGQTTATITSLCTGKIYCLVTDQGDGDEITVSNEVTIDEPGELQIFTFNNVHVTCNGLCNGRSTAVVTSGTAPYTYLWSDGQTKAGASNLCAGLYTLTVTDNNTCTTSRSTTITQPAALSPNGSSNNITCNGLCDGTASVAPTGGTSPYTYVWSTSSTSASINALCVGVYTCTITDSRNCSATYTATITQPPILSVTTSSVNVLCGGQCTGSAAVTPLGGTSPYTYAWSPGGQITSSRTGLCAGTYTVVVRDANNCSLTRTFNITQPTALSSVPTGTNVTCFGLCNGKAAANAAGGTGTYTYSWNPAAGTLATASALCPATYTIVVRDANSCSVTGTVTVTQPAILAHNGSSTNISCNGVCIGTASVAPSGGTTPYTYLWSTSATTSSISNLCAAAYTCTVTDSKGCTVTYNTTVTQPAVLSVTTSSVNVLCGGQCTGSAEVAPAGGASPYTYAWSPGGQTASSRSALCAGTYTVVVRDANSCSLTQTFNITQPTALTAVPTGTNVTCFSLCNGRTTANAAGGTGSYTYNWSPSGGSAATASSLCPATYSVLVTDANSCSVTSTVTVTQPAALAANGSSTNISCNTLCNGTASVAPSGGTTPYTYLWSTTATTSSISNLCAAAYTCTVTDSKVCTVTYNTTITQPAVLSVTTSSVNVLCGGQCTGSAGVTPAGGTSPYTYAWSPGGQTTSSRTGLCAGTYTVVVRDANNCSLTRTFNITQPTALSAVPTGTNVTCFSLCNGRAAANAAGGTGSYTYNWSPSGGSAATASSLCQNSYTVTVSDANSCIITGTISITQPAVLGATLTPTTVLCNGQCNGTASASVSGGTAPYTYLWSTGSTGLSSTGLCAGTYTFTVTDSKTCVFSQTVSVSQPNVLSATTSKTDLACGGSCIGTASVSPSGGTTPYTYLWSPGGQTISSKTGLCAGTYTVVIRDANNCSINSTITITQPSALTVGITSTSLTCNATCNGTATATVGGGTFPYSYSWNSGSTQSGISSLCAGTYTVTVRDFNNCPGTQTVSISQPAPLNIGLTTTSLTCNGVCDGAISANVVGGSSPYTYSWSTGSTISSTTGLCAGTYTLTVRDANNCSSVSTGTITQPAVLSATLTPTSVRCNAECNGAASASVSGGSSPYTYLWSTGGTNLSLTGLCSGTYTLTVTDNKSCSFSQTVSITQPNVLSANTSKTDLACGGACTGTATVNPAGGTTPYTYSWSPGGETSSSISNLCAATYTITVRDANNCTSTGTSIVTQPTSLTIGINSTSVTCNSVCDGSATATVGGGTSPFTYAWSTGGTDVSITSLCAGTYSISVLDFNNCIGTQTVTISQPAVLSAALTTTSVSCNSLCEGTVSANPAGGSAPYTYAWSTGGTNSSITGLCAGTYSLTLSDANNCTFTTNGTIAQPSVLSINTSKINASCAGACDGTATANPTGGTGTYTFAWLPGGETSQSISALCAGTYSVQVTDGNSCATSISLTITQPSPLTAPISGSTSTCSSCNGTATVSPAGGTAPYTYAWSDGQTTSTAVNLCIGDYTITVTDSKNCVATNTVNVDQLVNINITVLSSNISCSGNCDGIATASPAGGTQPYTYSWSPGSQTTQSITGQCVGTYTIEVTDALGCFNTNTVTLMEPSPLTLLTGKTDLSCNGTCDGTATANPSGGIFPYTYSWSPGGATSSSLTGLCADTYSVTVQDGNACIATGTVTITEALPIAANPTITGATCLANDGAIDLAPSGGAGGYLFAWQPGGQTTQNISNVAAGTYTVTITDAASCTGVFALNIANPTGPTLLMSESDNECNGACNGVASVTVTSGSGPFDYLWSTGGETTTAISNLCAGTYDVQVTDGAGCISFSSANITEPSLITPTVTVNNISCTSACDGSISLAVSGGTGGYSYAWQPGGETSSSISNLCPGTFTVDITDGNLCIVTQTITITQPATLTVSISSDDLSCNSSCDGGATASVSGGTSPYTYLWSPGGEILNTITNLCVGTYSISVVDNNNCVATETVTITEPPVLTSTVSGTDVTCNALCDGTGTVIASGGTSPYTYAWSPGSMSNASVTDLCAGSYTITVRDLNSCAITQTLSITEPSLLTTTVTSTNASCYGTCDGTASVSAAGGTSPYTYLWSPGGETTAMVSNLCQGSYSLTVTDANSCSLVETVIITEPNVFAVSISSTSVNCNSQCSGTVSAAIIGGTAPFTYAWNTGSTDASVSSLCAGTYSIVVGDMNGCIASETVSITEPSIFTTSITGTDISCNALCDGSGTAAASGGTFPYTYNWLPGGETSLSISNLCAGSYTVTVTDANSCSSLSTDTIFEPAALSGNPSGTNTSCAGVCDATAAINPTGGTGAYTFIWIPGGQTSNSLSNLCAGTYSVQISDANSCTLNTSITLTEPPVLSAAIIGNTPSCTPCSGSATINALGGSSPYTYSWSDGQTTATASNLCAGTYTIIVTDANICTTSRIVTITNAIDLSISVSNPNITCFGACDGIATANASGGTQPYTYSWSQGAQTNQTITGLCAGTYTVTVRDAIGCITSTTATLTEPAQLSLTPASANVSCNGACDGTALITPTGGTTSYTYLWSPGGQTSQSLSALCAGTYSITVSDANGCTATANISITEPSPIAANQTIQDAACLMSDGAITLAPSGGAGSGYTFAWQPGGETTQNISNIPAGNYTLTITDASSCTGTFIINVSNTNGPSLSTSQTNIDCNGACEGVATVTVTSGDAPFTYLWNPGGSTASSISNLCEGTYNAQVTDNVGCITIATVTITEPNPITSTITISPVSCNGNCDGSISMAISGGTGSYTYSWQPGGETTASITNLCAGTYTVDITDGNLCVSTETITITSPSALSINLTSTDLSCNTNCNGGATANVSGGTAPYTYSWEPGGQIINSITNLCAGTYSVTVTDANNCVATETVSITEPTALTSTVTGTNVSCNTVCDGSGNVVAGGGTTPYVYLWLPGGESTSSISNLCAATYSIVVTDSSGCSLTTALTVTQPNAINLGISQTDIICNGDCEGIISTNVSGGTASYTYAWAPSGNTTTSISALCAATYTVVVTDGNSCTASQAVTITEPTSLLANESSVNTSCQSSCDGSASVSPTGGTGSYTYLWSPGGETSSSISNLCAGTYTVTVRDASNCTDSKMVTIADPAPISIATSTIISANCGSCDGSIDITATGGAGSYSYQWSPGGETTTNITGLCAGLYTVTISDMNSCSSLITIPLNNNGGPTGETVITTSVSCNTSCDGSITVNPIGGTLPYTYSWTTGGQTTNTIAGLCAGVYILQVSDSNNCVRFVTDTVDEPAPLASNESIVNTSCVGVCNGSIMLAVTGGKGPYSYSWSPGGEISSFITSLCGGLYTLTVTDANNCTLLDTFTVSEPVINVNVLSTVNVSCNSMCDGSATVSVSGGMQPYYFQWDDPSFQMDSIASGLCAGTYEVTATDFNTCTGTATVVITEPTPITGNEVTTNATCGVCNGQGTLTPSGGLAPYTYLWNNGTTSSSSTSLCAGAYNVLITDFNGCTSNIPLIINNTGGTTGETIVTTSVTCFGACDGTASITPIGGTLPYTYQWIPGGQTTNALTGMCGGNYLIQVSDGIGCIRTATVTVDEPAQFNTNAVTVDATCGLCDGSITLSPSGGTTPYTYSWSVAGETNSSVTGLCPGMYTVSVNDASGCSQMFNMPVSNPTGPTVTLSPVDLSCNSICNGSIGTLVTGGAMPYTYTWSNAQTTSSISGICSGNYFVQVTDNLGCVTIETATINEPSAISFNIANTTSPECNGLCNGSITSLPLGGTPAYSYAWAPSGGTNAIASNLCAGSYSVTVRDANGCSAVQIAVLTQPAALSISKTLTNASCNNTSDGDINVTVSGGTNPYSFLWSNGATTEDLLNIPYGTYTLTVTDANSCTTSSITNLFATITVFANAGNDTIFCEGDSILLKGNGSIGALAYQWYQIPASTLIGTTANIKAKVSFGSTQFMLIAINSTCSDTDTVTVFSIPPPEVNAGADNEIFRNASTTIGGSPTGPSGSTFIWTPAYGLNDTLLANPVASPTLTTTYMVTVTNSNGCSYSDTIRVTVLPKVIFAGGFTPNNDGKNDTWEIDYIDKFPYCTVEIYNRWGELLFNSTGYTTKWDGTYKGKPLPVGTYYYVINLNDPVFPEPYTGPVTILR